MYAKAHTSKVAEFATQTRKSMHNGKKIPKSLAQLVADSLERVFHVVRRLVHGEL